MKKVAPFDPVETPPGCCRRVNDFVTSCNAAAIRWMQSAPGTPARAGAVAELALLKSLGLWCVLPLMNESTHSQPFAKFAADSIAAIQPLIAHDDTAQFPPAPDKAALVLDNLENLQRGQQVANAFLEIIAQDVRRLITAEDKRIIREITRRAA